MAIRETTVRVRLEDNPNVVLVFHDEEGREWLAAAFLGNLIRFEGDNQVEAVEVESLKDRVFTLHEFKVVCHG